MKCPLFTATSISQGGGINYTSWKCLKEECAWWDGFIKQCGFLSMVKDIRQIRWHLGDIRDKMPSGQSFVK